MPVPDITAEEGRTITSKAALWRGTEYALVGESSMKGNKGDCSGTTYKIYAEANLPYVYFSTESFPSYASGTGRFRKLADNANKQDGDILLWDAHMAIYSTFKSGVESIFATTERVNKSGSKWTQFNDMWTASHPSRREQILVRRRSAGRVSICEGR
jgi:cell wall-associated NlpC family hydrolase